MTIAIGVTSTVAYERRPQGGGAPTDVSNAKYTFNVTGSTGDIIITVNPTNITTLAQFRAGIKKLEEVAAGGGFGFNGNR